MIPKLTNSFLRWGWNHQLDKEPSNFSIYIHLRWMSTWSRHVDCLDLLTWLELLFFGTFSWNLWGNLLNILYHYAPNTLLAGVYVPKTHSSKTTCRRDWSIGDINSPWFVFGSDLEMIRFIVTCNLTLLWKRSNEEFPEIPRMGRDTVDGKKSQTTTWHV